MQVYKGFQLASLVLLSYVGFTECGNICLSCSEVENKMDCTHLETCRHDEVCYVHKYLTESKVEKYDLGCIFPELCSNQDGMLFGRSVGEGHHLMCIGCCNNTNICNMNTHCGISIVHNTSVASNLPRECDEINSTYSGVFTIYPDGRKPVEVYCIMDNGEQWTVIQRRMDGSVDFYRTWNEYKTGFGSPNGEYWLGNENIHLLSASSGHQFSIYLEDFESSFKYANYSNVLIGDEHHDYVLTFTNFSGSQDVGDSLDYSRGRPFSTKDKDNSLLDCPVQRHGGWWYWGCARSNLNGPYLGGQGKNDTTLEWDTWRVYYSLKKTTMMIKRMIRLKHQ